MAPRNRIVGNSGYHAGPRWFPDEQLDPDARRLLQDAYGVEFSDEGWDELQKHLYAYAVWGAVELGSLSVPEVLAGLADIDEKASALLMAIFSIGADDDERAPQDELATDRAGREARNQAHQQRSRAMQAATREAIETSLAGLRRNPTDPWDIIRSDIEAELAALGRPDSEDRAWEMTGKWRGHFPEASPVDGMIDKLYELGTGVAKAREAYDPKGSPSPELPTFAPGDQWRGFVRGLARWAQSYRYPVSHRNDGDVFEKASDFIEFLYALQELMPAEYRRHNGSKTALTTAVARALKD